MTKLFITLLSIGLYLSASAQCQADFNYSITNGTVDFTNTSSGSGLSNNWSFGNGSTSNQTNPSYTYTVSGNYLVCLSIFDSLTQCQSTFCDSIFVMADTTGGDCNSVSNAYGAGGTIVGSASGASIYLWEIYDNSWNPLYSTGNANFNYSPGTNGLYNVCVTTYDSMQNYCDSMCYMIQIQDTIGGGGCLTASSVAIDPNGNVVGAASGASFYNWTVYDNSWMFLSTSTGSTLNYTPSAPGGFNVCLIAYDTLNNECDSICYFVASDSTSGLSIEEELVFNVYPNPTQGMVTIEMSNEQITELVIMDITGSVIMQKDITKAITEIDLSLYPKGLYFIHALGRNSQRLSTSKVLRQ